MTSPEPQTSYHGQPVLKPPVWTWEVPAYFFVGGTSGMSGVLALGSLAGEDSLLLTRGLLWVALVGALVSPVLLILDLGRPARFLNMLRVFKWRSAMSLGVWTLIAFTSCAGTSVLLFEGYAVLVRELGVAAELVTVALSTAIALTAVFGALLATYTGVLLGASAIPVWAANRALLPLHFGVAGLGSAASLAVLLAGDSTPLLLLLAAAAAVETLLLIKNEVSGRGRVVLAPLRRGSGATRLRIATLLMGPVALAGLMIGAAELSALAFLAGSLLSRYAWLALGRESARDPRAVL
ncbi:MAG: polysulfide reductase NrfD [Polyangiaceae bacterium]|nr:polysulfide reductase NrfD [Polyangiaceae bacterium]